ASPELSPLSLHDALPISTAATNAAPVQLSGVPLPTTTSGLEVSSSSASGGTGQWPPGLPVAAARRGAAADHAATTARAAARRLGRRARVRRQGASRRCGYRRQRRMPPLRSAGEQTPAPGSDRSPRASHDVTRLTLAPHA